MYLNTKIWNVINLPSGHWLIEKWNRKSWEIIKRGSYKNAASLWDWCAVLYYKDWMHINIREKDIKNMEGCMVDTKM